MAKQTAFVCGVLLALTMPVLADAQSAGTPSAAGQGKLKYIAREDMAIMPLPAAPEGVVRLSASADLTSVMQEMRSGKSSFALPQTFLIDLHTGQQASLADVPSALADFMRAHPAPKMQGKPPATRSLAELLSTTLHEDGRPFTRADLGDGKRYALFQLWAGWCAPCLQEAKELGELLKNHPLPELAWVAVEADPTKPHKNMTAGERTPSVADSTQEH